MGLPYKCPKCLSIWLEGEIVLGGGCNVCVRAHENGKPNDKSSGGRPKPPQPDN